MGFFYSQNDRPAESKRRDAFYCTLDGTLLGLLLIQSTLGEFTYLYVLMTNGAQRCAVGQRHL